MKRIKTPKFAVFAVIIAGSLVMGTTLRDAFAETDTTQTNQSKAVSNAARPSKSNAARNAPGKDAKPAAVLRKAISKDGTSLAFEQSGQGPAVILISSALADRSAAARLAGLMSTQFTVITTVGARQRGHAALRRGREIEDVEALIDHAGGSAFLFGSSSGAVLALEAAAKLPSKVDKLALYEPPFIVDGTRPPVPAEFAARVNDLVSSGRRGEAVEYFMTRAAGMPADLVASMRRMPMWAGMEKLAHTLPYDGAIMRDTQAGKPLPAQRWTSISVRTLVIDGEKSDAFLRNAAQAIAAILPKAQRRTLAGQDHGVVVRAPSVLAPVVMEFFTDRSEGR
jgi:pimeloyl-ACP methyl ester carboxylesterase